MKITSKDLALTSIFAALYAVLVYFFAPISFYLLQFRVAGILRPAIAKKWILSIGYAVGVVVGNIFSPFSGPYELLFMPIMSLVAGMLGFLVAKKLKESYFVAGIVIAIVIPLSVSWMLYQLFALPWLETFPYLLISEQIICLIGAITMTLIDTRYNWWK